jgi:hypothetical protein
MEQTLAAREWIVKCSARLQQHWRTIDPDRLEDLASDLWTDQRLRAMEPTAAAEEWLRPVLAQYQ